MIWYILYPLRGTTEAPELAPNHPLRSALTRYGRYAARHVVTTLLVSVAVAATLIYPFPFLYTTDFTIAAPNLPLHVWTDAQPLGEKYAIEPDVIMRSIWVHGSYMMALNRDVLLGSLELQDEVLGPTTNFHPRRPGHSIATVDPNLDLSRDDRDAFHVVNGLTNQSWFFHSPLQYWAGDADNILKDTNFLATVNEKKTQPTSVNVTLRHSIVFSGKKFEDRKLIAADALVITLLHLRDSPVGRQWERKIKEYVARTPEKWDVFPSDGVPTGSQLYEFQFRPISVHDTIVLSLAYILTATYFLLSLSKIRAVKSKLGLIVAVVAQIIMAIVSSLTVCALFRIDLSRIPRASYPLVLMAMSLENVFRLINAVILTPADHSTSSRIGHAFGEKGHVALAGVAQNLLILWGLSNVVSAGVSAFCTFAAIAILFDFFYLSTFFLSVLSVDVRRTELKDALEKAAIGNNRTNVDNQPRQSILAGLVQGRLALSTRIAGTIVMLGFVLMAQWHFFDSGNTSGSPLRIMRYLWSRGNESVSSVPPYAGLHQARSPKSWLRLQDHETAKEVINVVKPWAHSYIARVYDPIIFVLKGADRNPKNGSRWFPDAAYDFVHHQLTPFAVTILLLVALVHSFMNYLLWDEIVEARGEDDYDEEPLISIRSLEHGHDLDIFDIAVAPDSKVISAALDRQIRVWNLRYDFASYTLTGRPPSALDGPFPVIAMAVDEEAVWLAVLSTFQVMLWNIAEQQWGPSVAVDLYGQKPEAFFFGPTKRLEIPSIVIVRRNGTLVELWPDEPDSSDMPVCKSPLNCVTRISGRGTSALVTLSRNGCIYRVINHDSGWISSEVRLQLSDDDQPLSVVAVHGFSAYLAVFSKTISLVDLSSSAILHEFVATEPMKPRSLRFVHHSHRKGTKDVDWVSSVTLAYTSEEDGACVLQTYLPREDTGYICFQHAICSSNSNNRSQHRDACEWSETRLITRRVTNPGTWTPIRNGCIVGVRKSLEKPEPSGSPIRDRLPAFAQSSLRRRGPRNTPSPGRRERPGTWETWVMSRLEKEGNIETKPLEGPEDHTALLIPHLGPMAKVGHGSVAVGFGTVIKVITVGHEYFDHSEDDGGLKNDGLVGTTRRRRPPTSRARAVSLTNWGPAQDAPHLPS